MSVLTAVSFDEIKTRGVIATGDVSAIRRAFYDDGVIDQAEADALLALDSACKTKDACWTDCLVEMVTDCLVEQVKPTGYITAENASWLMSRIAPDGLIHSRTTLELLVHVIERARWSPHSLTVTALDTVSRAVLAGEGPLREASPAPAGTITDEEVELLKRILYAFGGDGNIGVTRAEAGCLFDIEAATAGNANADGWRDLFVKAIANCVMNASGYAVPSREEALAQDAWLDRRGELSPATMLGATAHAGTGALLSVYREQSPMERAVAKLERQKIEIITGEDVTPAEAAWLAERIGRDGRVTANEQALLDYLVANSPKVAPELEAAIGRLRAAA